MAGQPRRVVDGIFIRKPEDPPRPALLQGRTNALRLSTQQRKAMVTEIPCNDIVRNAGTRSAFDRSTHLGESKQQIGRDHRVGSRLEFVGKLVEGGDATQLPQGIRNRAMHPIVLKP